MTSWSGGTTYDYDYHTHTPLSLAVYDEAGGPGRQNYRYDGWLLSVAVLVMAAHLGLCSLCSQSHQHHPAPPAPAAGVSWPGSPSPTHLSDLLVVQWAAYYSYDMRSMS